MRSETIIGRVHAACGSRLRYAKGLRCVRCSLATTARWRERKGFAPRDPLIMALERDPRWTDVQIALAKAAMRSFVLNGCRLWTGATNSRGYGHTSVRGRWIALHRAILEDRLGRALKPGEEAIHVCDLPSCWATNHVVLGSHAQNMADAARKGRLSGARPRLMSPCHQSPVTAVTESQRII
jgi:hypothetical protein